MAGAVDKKIIDIKEELDSSPTTHLSSRTGILDSVTLIREFSETDLQPLTEKFTSGSGSYALSEVCEALAQQRAICYGARTIKTTFKKFDLPAYETVNGALGLTEPNTSFMGINATDIGETYSINLTSLEGTQTQGSNTFSTDVRDYYLVRSRVTGELIDINDSIDPYSTPDSETAFGNAIAWGEDVGSEAGTWNADYAKANIASVGLQSEGLFNELKIMTLQDHLEQGSNTNYTTLGAAFGQKFYLKRHADYVNTFTIIGTTNIDSIEITDISDEDLAKIKYGDVISGENIPDNNVTIAGLKTVDSKIRLSNTGVATESGTVTLTVNSVPFGYAENDIFCQIEIVGEGLVTNPDWMPVGDDAGDYSSADAGADALLNANTSQFIGLLGFFDPDNGSANATNDLSKGARGDWVSEGKEYGGAYPYKEKNPFFPAIGITRKSYEVDNGEIVGTQPTGLDEDDIPSGRYIKFDYERANNTSVMPENRYYVDQAEKFYYELPCNSQYVSGSVTIGTAHPMPNTGEPIAAIVKTGMSGAVTRITAIETLAGQAWHATLAAGSNTTANWTIPADTAIHTPTANGAGSTPTNQYSYYYRLNGGIVEKRGWKTEYSGDGSNFTSSGRQVIAAADYVVVSNFIARKLTTDGSTANLDIALCESSIDDLQTVATANAEFRDPVSTSNVANPGITDAAFDTWVCATTGTNTFDASLSTVKASITALYAAAEMADRETGTVPQWGALTGATPDLGTSINCASFGSGDNTHAKWISFASNTTTLGTTLSNRVAEIDARIGVPTRAGTPSTSYKQYPAVYVSAVPTANTTGGYVPYGRAIYNSCNHLLGNHLKLLTQLISDIQGLDSLVDLVKKARNKYEIFNGRAKEY
jgi:hypothetical protein